MKILRKKKALRKKKFSKEKLEGKHFIISP